ncbi:S8 family serine peptidase [bacterium]|nr:S8 family serine peptidase [bacterium]
MGKTRRFIATMFMISLLGITTTATTQADVQLRGGIERALQQAQPDSRIPLFVGIENRIPGSQLQSEVKGMNWIDRRDHTVNRLKQNLAFEGTAAEQWLESEVSAGRADNLRTLWIAHGFAVKLRADRVEALMQVPGVRMLHYDREREHDEVERSEESVPSPGELDNISAGVEFINAPAVWAQGFTGQGIVVSSMDTGVDEDHPDLVNRFWVNEDEIPDNGIDDDENGYEDDVHGWNFVNDNNDISDIQGHGSKVAGVLVGDGSLTDTTGMAPGANVMILRIYDQFSSSETRNWEAIQYSVENGARVISASLSYDYHDIYTPEYETHRDVQSNSLAAGMIQANSTGNNGNDLTEMPIPWNVAAPANCPAAWLHPDQTIVGGITAIVGVGAGNRTDTNVPSWSDHGPSEWYDPDYPEEYRDYPWLDGDSLGLLKPDVIGPYSVVTTSRYGSYVGFSGTSAATPHVGGLMVLMRGAVQQATTEEIAEAVQMTCVDYEDPGKDNRAGAGMVMADSAFNYLLDMFSTGRARVAVFDPDGQPVTGARVEVGDGEVVGFSDTNGVAMMPHIITGTYDFTVYGGVPFAPFTLEQLAVTEDDTLELTAQLAVANPGMTPSPFDIIMNSTDTTTTTFSIAPREGLPTWELGLTTAGGIDWQWDEGGNIRPDVGGATLEAVAFARGFGPEGSDGLIAGLDDADQPTFWWLGEEIQSEPQPARFGPIGARDLASIQAYHDPSLNVAWAAVAREQIFLLDSTLTIIDSLDAHSDDPLGVAYDPDEETFYVSTGTAQINIIESDGGFSQRGIGLLIHGLACHPYGGIDGQRVLYGFAREGAGLATLIAIRLSNWTFGEQIDFAPDETDEALGLDFSLQHGAPVTSLVSMQSSGTVKVFYRQVDPEAFAMPDEVIVFPEFGADFELTLRAPRFRPGSEVALSLTVHDITEGWTYYSPVNVTINDLAADQPAEPALPSQTRLAAPYPNPFNPEVRLEFDLAKPGQTQLAVYNVLGREVARLVDSNLRAGHYSVSWNGARQAGGVYFAVLKTGSVTQARKLLLLK